MNTNILKSTCRKKSVYPTLDIFSNFEVSTSEFYNYESYQNSIQKNKRKWQSLIFHR